MSKKIDVKPEMVEKTSESLAGRITETKGRLEALDAELAAIGAQHDVLAGAEVLDCEALNSLLARRTAIQAEQLTLVRRVAALKEQIAEAEKTEGVQRLHAIAQEQLHLATEADENCQVVKDILHDLAAALEALRKTLRARNELSAEASYLAVACEVERPHLPPLVAIVDRSLLAPVTSALEGLNTSTAASSAWWQKIKVLKEAQAVEARKNEQQPPRPLVTTRQASPVPERVEKSRTMDHWIHGHTPQGFPVRL